MRVWIFADFDDLDEKEFEVLRTLNVTDVVLGIADEGPSTFALNYSEQTIINNCKKLDSMGLSFHFMSWVRRESKFLDNMVSALVNLCKKIKPASILFDAEKHWHKGSMSVSSATNKLKKLMQNEELKDIPVGITGLSTMQGSVKTLCEAFPNYCIPQAYSIWKPGSEEHWSHSDSTSTPHLQRQSFNSWSSVYTPDKIVMGLAAYWLQRPGVSAKAVFDTALEATKALDITDVAFWSLNHIKQSTETQNMIRSIRGQGGPQSFSHHTEVQWLLMKLGHDLGKSGPRGDGVDGKWGTKSQAALVRFRLDHDLPSQGMYDITDILWMVSELRQRTL